MGVLQIEEVLSRARAARGLNAVFYYSVRQAGSLGRRCTAFRPQIGEILIGQMRQDSVDARRVFNTGEELDRVPAFRGDYPEILGVLILLKKAS